MIPCRQATFLISKRHETSLAFGEAYDLLVHLLVCKFCRRFLKQTRILIRLMKNLNVEEGLTVEEKRKLRGLLGQA